MLLNIFQILSKYLNNETLIKLNHIHPNIILKNTIIKRLGFIPTSITNYLEGEHYILRGSLLILHFNEGFLHVYMDQYTSIHFLITKDDQKIMLNAFALSYYDSKRIKNLIKHLKTMFVEFALDDCCICHSCNLEITIHLPRGSQFTITLPYYIHSNIIESVV